MARHHRTQENIPAPPASPAEHLIRERAYEIWISRGCGHGRDLEDWLEAERQLARTPAVVRAGAAA